MKAKVEKDLLNLINLKISLKIRNGKTHLALIQVCMGGSSAFLLSGSIKSTGDTLDKLLT